MWRRQGFDQPLPLHPERSLHQRAAHSGSIGIGEFVRGYAMTGTSNTSAGNNSRLLARYAWLLDSSIPLPFGRSIGLDGIIGLIPGIGDALGAILSSAVIFGAWRMGTPRSVLLRMAGNVAIETVIGTIPIVGDLFDFAFKANQRNVQLLQRFEQDTGAVRRQSRWVVAATAATAILFLAGLVTGVTLLGIALVRLLTGG
ncbi:DUF4112 domain-containing protein [Haliea sp. E1-2-M8]|uniref:DUF4112 domain-containing protein n=1 Tax=Haliea sp. E1-2-M8 TaxID=3064706 RepID=UPI00272250AF|nr:DUF4112 domain-containing protein [Haliea sp. E1-2-M8]MDO8862984.1 DUF4112 domain-containing protein [Haliea sp. E1-2-M8]